MHLAAPWQLRPFGPWRITRSNFCLTPQSPKFTFLDYILAKVAINWKVLMTSCFHFSDRSFLCTNRSLICSHFLAWKISWTCDYLLRKSRGRFLFHLLLWTAKNCNVIHLVVLTWKMTWPFRGAAQIHVQFTQDLPSNNQRC